MSTIGLDLTRRRRICRGKQLFDGDLPALAQHFAAHKAIVVQVATASAKSKLSVVVVHAIDKQSRQRVGSVRDPKLL